MDDAMLAVASQQTLSLFITEASYNTFVGTGRDGSIQQLSSLPLLLRQQRSIAFDAGLTCDGSSSEQQGQLIAPDAAMYSAHFNFSKINRLFTLAKGGLGSCNKLVERQSSEEELLVH
eukprot:Em0003g1712a